MGGGRASLHSSRSEFLAADALNGDLEYKRNGGCFVTTKKAIACLVLAIAASIIVGVLMYYYGPNRQIDEKNVSNDIEALLNNSIDAISAEDLTLPKSIYPMQYRLRIHPILDENTTNHFTFNGRVTIVVKIVDRTKKIVLNVDDLQIITTTVSRSMKGVGLKSASQVKEVPLSNNNTNNNPSMGLTNSSNGTSVNSTNTHLNGNFTNLPNVTTTVSPIAFNYGTVSSTLSTPSMQSTFVTNAPPVTQSSKVSGNVSTTQITETNHSDYNPVIPLATQPEVIENKTTVNYNSTSTAPTTIQQTTPSTASEATYIGATTSMHDSSKVINIRIKNIEEEQDSTKFIINFVEYLEPNCNYTIDIQYMGKISDNLAGLYKTSYMDDDGTRKWLATTSMLPSNAKKVFPCFDEPEFKSEYTISIARKTSMVVLSNMPVRASEPMLNNPGWVWDHFQTSPLMSTYHVAFTISEFKKLQSNTSNIGAVFNVWAPKHVLPMAQYALDSGMKIMTYLEKYFGVKYPLQKIDFVVIPEMADDVLGSWGLISLRESSVLINPNTESFESKSGVFNVIAQGISQQWFGNLVTIKSWNEFWLNKAINMFMADLATAYLEPSWDYYNSFALRITQPALYLDSLKSTHSLYLNTTNLQTEQLFDNVYKKGTCLLRMLNYTLTSGVFQTGIQNYLQKWKYDSSDIINLWQTYGDVSENNTGLNISVKEFMNSWVFQNGYPVVSVSRDYDSGFVNISQEHFSESKKSSPNLWYIPLSYQIGSANKTEGKLVMAHKESILVDSFKDTPKDTWILFNIDQTGFYRVNYDSKNWILLQNQLEKDPEKISPSNRAQILSDAFELAEMGYVNYNISLNLTKYLSMKETNYIPFIAALQSLMTLKPIFGSSGHYGVFEDYIKKLVKRSYETLGNEPKQGENFNNSLLRNYIIKIACDIEYEPCVTWAKQKYTQWMSSSSPNTNSIPIDLKQVVMCTSIKTGGSKEWEYLWNKTISPNTSESDLKIFYLSLGCTKEAWLVYRYLEKSINGQISLQNIPYVWKSISHPEVLGVGLTFLREKWHVIVKSYEDVSSIFKGIVEDFMSKLSTNSDLEDLTLFYKSHSKDLKLLSLQIKGTVDRIKLRIEWREKYLQSVASWMENHLS